MLRAKPSGEMITVAASAALVRGEEIDGRSSNADTLPTRNYDRMPNGIVDVHRIIEVSSGLKHHVSTNSSEIQEFAKTKRERQLDVRLPTHLQRLKKHRGPVAFEQDISMVRGRKENRMKSLAPFLQHSIKVAAVAAVVIFPWSFSSTAHGQESFYEGKTLTIIEGRAPGGTGDIRVRTLVPFLEKYIPGNPKIILEYMPGGGSRKAANHLFSSTRPDGLTIGNMSSGVVSLGVLKAPGVLYDLDQFVFLGSPFSVHQAVFLTRKKLGVDTLDKLRDASGVRIGGQSVGFSTYNEGRLFAYIIGLKEPVFITGYAGAEIDPAMMRGELDGRATSGDTVLRRNPDWLKGDLVNFHAILEVPKGTKHDHPVLANLPTLESLAQNDLDRKVIGMQRAFRLVGQPFVAPPGIPPDRLAMIQEGFRKTFQDPEFHKAYEKFTASDATPIMPEDHAQAVKDIPRDPEVVEIFSKLVGGGPLPPRGVRSN